MALARIINSVRTDSVIPYMICEYSADGIGADTTITELIELELPNISLGNYSHRHIPNLTTNGQAYALNLFGISISCDSTNLDFVVLNKNDISLLYTINEIIRYEGVNRAESDQNFDGFIIRNRDNTLTNKLYLYLNNHATVPTGTIRLELIYVATQDREF